MLCDDAHIQSLNKEWRGVDAPTDVLSFELEDDDEEDEDEGLVSPEVRGTAEAWLLSGSGRFVGSHAAPAAKLWHVPAVVNAQLAICCRRSCNFAAADAVVRSSLTQFAFLPALHTSSTRSNTLCVVLCVCVM